MGLIVTDRHTKHDLAAWEKWQRVDREHALRLGKRFESMVAKSAEVMRAFAAEGPCYLGISWGKDSVVCAHIAATHAIDVPCAWVRLDDEENPDCPLVRDAFLARFALDYHEIRAEVGSDERGGRRTTAGFAECSRRFGDRHISGVRADESRVRKIVMAKLGDSSERTCRPIGWWRTEDVFAYLTLHDLPVHPAYGYLGAFPGGKTYDRNRLRTAAIGGARGLGHGRGAWEARYYPEIAKRWWHEVDGAKTGPRRPKR